MTPAEFENIFHQYNKQLIYLASSMVGGIYAEDIVADAFIKLYNAKHDDYPSTFLYRVVKNACLNHIRHNKRAEKKHKEILYSAEIIETIKIKSEVLGMIWKQVNSLSGMQKTIMLLIYKYDLTVNEIAERMGISTDTCRVHHFRALGKLKNKFV